jgi:hypothetical protein
LAVEALVGVPNNALAGFWLCFTGLAFFSGLGVRLVGVSTRTLASTIFLGVPLFFGVILLGGNSMEK